MARLLWKNATNMREISKDNAINSQELTVHVMLSMTKLEGKNQPEAPLAREVSLECVDVCFHERITLVA